jgi:CRISPR-associated protein Cas5d
LARKTVSVGKILLYVDGKRACFTRPEYKTERLSYDVITPSAARGILDAIYWHPEMLWKIDRIHVLNPIKYASIMRNEVKSAISPISIIRAANAGEIVYLSAPDDRVQRNSMILRDVAYVIEAHIELSQKGVLERCNINKYYTIFSNRVNAGQYYYAPVLGCREFPVENMRLLDKPYPSQLKGVKELGFMLAGIDYKRDKMPMFFEAVMVDGVIEVPNIDNDTSLMRMEQKGYDEEEECGS